MLDTEIRSQIESLLAGNVSLRKFQEWFVPATWDIEKSTDDETTRNLVYTIELWLAEYTNGHLPEEDLRRDLEGLLHPTKNVIVVNELSRNAGMSIATGTSARTMTINSPRESTPGVVVLS